MNVLYLYLFRSNQETDPGSNSHLNFTDDYFKHFFFFLGNRFKQIKLIYNFRSLQSGYLTDLQQLHKTCKLMLFVFLLIFCCQYFVNIQNCMDGQSYFFFCFFFSTINLGQMHSRKNCNFTLKHVYVLLGSFFRCFFFTKRFNQNDN